MKIAILSTEYLKDYLQKAVQELDLNCETEIFIFYNYVHIVDLYRQLENQFDGFVTTGPVPMQTIRKSVPNCKPLRFFLCSESNYYKTFFEVIYRYQDWNFEKGYFDFCDYLCPDQEQSLVQYLKDGTFKEWLDRNNNYMANMTVPEMQRSTVTKLKKHIDLWNSGKIEYSLSRMSPIMPDILDAGVNCYYISFSYDDILLCFRQVMQDILEGELKETQPASIELVPLQAKEDDLERLRRLLTAFNKKFSCDFIINPTRSGFRISTTYRLVDKLTEGMTLCHLREYLSDAGEENLAIGYGLGRELPQAEANAIDAARESRIGGCKHSYVFCEDRRQIGLFGAGSDLSIQGPVTPYMREIADRTGLSTLTVQKLMAAFRITGTEEVTTLDLSRTLHITIRSVNRLLSTLVKCNLAEPLYARQTNTKGRPSTVYRILLKEP